MIWKSVGWSVTVLTTALRMRSQALNKNRNANAASENNLTLIVYFRAFLKLNHCNKIININNSNRSVCNSFLCGYNNTK